MGHLIHVFNKNRKDYSKTLGFVIYTEIESLAIWKADIMADI